MKKILVGFVALSFLIEPSLVMAGERKPIEPQGAARAAQYNKAVTLCRNHFSEFSRSSEIVARWETHRGKTAWYCVI